MVMARGRHAGSSEAEFLQSLLEACGQCEEVPEAQVDIHTGLSGSGVAFVSVVWSTRPRRPSLCKAGPSQVPVMPSDPGAWSPAARELCCHPRHCLPGPLRPAPW